jgi:hypothetical protein
MNDIILRKDYAALAMGEDPFQIAFRPAQRALDAIISVREPMAWLSRQRRSSKPLYDPDRAAELIEIIPESRHLAAAGALFLEAEEQPAPEGWLHVVLGIMLDSEPGAINVPDAFRCAVADGLYRDPEVWECYDPGFSAPVVVRAIREARRLESALSPGAFIKLCLKHRRQFRQMHADIGALMEIRWKAEDALEESGQRPAVTYTDDDPF